MCAAAQIIGELACLDRVEQKSIADADCKSGDEQSHEKSGVPASISPNRGAHQEDGSVALLSLPIGRTRGPRRLGHSHLLVRHPETLSHQYTVSARRYRV